MSLAARHSTRASDDLFGHPRGLAYLFATEMWERFSYYGMRALLTLYMVKYLLLPDRINQVWGEPALRGTLEALFGPLGVQPFASQIYGLYTSLVYFTPILGGLIADRLLGQRRTVIIGASLMAIGHFMMASERLFLLALVMLMLGNGAFKPNISTQVGALYPPGDPRRDRAFSIFYVGINIGAFFSPIVCGTLAVALGWHYGFAAAGVGMLIGLAIYLKARPFSRPMSSSASAGNHATRSHATNVAASSPSQSYLCQSPCFGRPMSSKATRSRSGLRITPFAHSTLASGAGRSRRSCSSPSTHS